MTPFEEPKSPDVFPDLHSATDGDGLTPVALEAEELAIEHFSTWLDSELEKLVAKWSHLASPKASAGRGQFNRALRS